MALSRRADRRARLDPTADPTQGDGGTGLSGTTQTLDTRKSLALQDLLLARGFATEEQLLSFDATTSSADLGDQLVAGGILSESHLIAARSELSSLPIADLRTTTPSAQALSLIPDSMAREHFVIPLSLNGNGLTVAISDQPTPELLHLLRETTRQQIVPMLAPQSQIRLAIDNNYRAIGGLDHLVQAFEAVEETRRRPTTRETASATQTIADDAPVVQVVGRILTQAMRDRASDVHVEPSELGVRVRYRIDGALKEVLTLPTSMAVGLISRIKIMAGMNIVERRRPQDGQLRTEIDGREVDVRVSTLATIWGEKCVMRLLDRSRSRAAALRSGDARSVGDHVFPFRPCTVRHGPVRRAHRERQDDDPVRNAHGDQRSRAEM